MAEDIDSRIASHFFRAVAAADDFLLRIEHTDADLQSVADVALDLGILKARHGVRQSGFQYVHRRGCFAT